MSLSVTCSGWNRKIGDKSSKVTIPELIATKKWLQSVPFSRNYGQMYQHGWYSSTNATTKLCTGVL